MLCPLRLAQRKPVLARSFQTPTSPSAAQTAHSSLQRSSSAGRHRSRTLPVSRGLQGSTCVVMRLPLLRQRSMRRLMPGRQRGRAADVPQAVQPFSRRRCQPTPRFAAWQGDAWVWGYHVISLTSAERSSQRNACLAKLQGVRQTDYNAGTGSWADATGTVSASDLLKGRWLYAAPLPKSRALVPSRSWRHLLPTRLASRQTAELACQAAGAAAALAAQQMQSVMRTPCLFDSGTTTAGSGAAA